MRAATIEAHHLHSRSALCPTCQQWTAIHMLFALVNGDSLHVITRVVHATCPCGWEDTYRT